MRVLATGILIGVLAVNPSIALAQLVVGGDLEETDLAAMVQRDLVTLGYEPGNTGGDVTTQTIVAVSQFQAEHDMEITGEITATLAGAVKAAISQQGQGTASGVSAASASESAAPDPAVLQAAQQACLQQKMVEAQESQEKKRGLRSLARAVSRTASRFGGNDISREVAKTAADVYTATAVAGDLQSAAKDLGLTESDIEQCRNP